MAWTSLVWQQCLGLPERRRSPSAKQAGGAGRPKGSKGLKCQVKESPLSFHTKLGRHEASRPLRAGAD